jgi:hypothetical protein
LVSESHAEVIEVPKYRAKRVTVHLESFITNVEIHIVSQAMTQHMIPIGHDDMSTTTVLKLNASAPSRSPTDEVVSSPN